MREILYRGKRVDNGDWTFGFLSMSRLLGYKGNTLQYSIDYEEKGVMLSSVVIPETVGQYTGLTDKNGKKIFEHDEIEYDDTPYTAYAEKQTGRIVWRYGSLCFEYSVFGGVHYRAMCSEDFFAAKSTVIGNIHERSEE